MVLAAAATFPLSPSFFFVAVSCTPCMLTRCSPWSTFRRYSCCAQLSSSLATPKSIVDGAVCAILRVLSLSLGRAFRKFNFIRKRYRIARMHCCCGEVLTCGLNVRARHTITCMHDLEKPSGLIFAKTIFFVSFLVDDACATRHRALFAARLAFLFFHSILSPRRFGMPACV